MQPYHRAPLFAYRLLLHDRTRTMASIGGVVFALVLMMMQVGFRNSLMDSGLQLIRILDADIVVMSANKYPFLRYQRMTRQRIYQALSIDGVASAKPVWMDLMRWTNTEARTLHPIRLIAIDPNRLTLDIPAINGQAYRLLKPGTALLDSRSRDTLGTIVEGPAVVNRKQLDIVGTFPLGTDFEVEGTLVVSESTFFDLRRRDQRMLELALLEVADGFDPREVAAEIQQALPPDVIALSKSDLIARDRSYWESSTPVSLILMVGLTLGFLSGIVICYQILYTEVLDHLAEFATLKAMGYGNRFIQAVVLAEAITLSVIGYVPAIFLGSALVFLLGVVSGLPATLSWGDAVIILVFSVAMCTGASFFALRKVRVVDPAELF